ncbi:hypothetical protein PLESTB_001321900 [Pleodorina starrii]|uniref:Uncharacterized protein n=1 Tax=Pleodorina starrii TaxID=330485 RepID=A0A9W6BTY6_9CHLO|nr:hypothetical protein PLESTM_001618100 [Pleodorina starrii]GLC58134.1 hypothetical protein PLESTB_001321900 [Pleodorina starrii]GLC66824.1 hypothetical protein PLESTF_000478300 [Pleodorina starrii]
MCVSEDPAAPLEPAAAAIRNPKKANPQCPSVKKEVFFREAFGLAAWVHPSGSVGRGRSGAGVEHPAKACGGGEGIKTKPPRWRVEAAVVVSVLAGGRRGRRFGS